jgi:hypothetical protein
MKLTARVDGFDKAVDVRVPRSYAGQDLLQDKEYRDMSGKQCIRNPGFYLSLPTACGRLDM